MYALHLPWAAPILSASGSLKIVQILSLGLSIASLIVIYQIVFETPLIQAKTARLYSFALICFLPQFIMFTLYVSNDTLAIFMGCLTVLQTYRLNVSFHSVARLEANAVVGCGFRPGPPDESYLLGVHSIKSGLMHRSKQHQRPHRQRNLP